MAEVYDKGMMQSGLQKLRDGIIQLQEGCDEIRLAVTDSTGDTYLFVELGVTLVQHAATLMWQFHQRARQRFHA